MHTTTVTHASTFHLIAPAGARCLDVMIYTGGVNARMPAVQAFLTRGSGEDVVVNNSDLVYYEISGDYTYVYVTLGGSTLLSWNVNYTTNRTDTTVEALNSAPDTTSLTPAKKIHYSWDVPSFYKSYNTLAELKAALANV